MIARKLLGSFNYFYQWLHKEKNNISDKQRELIEELSDLSFEKYLSILVIPQVFHPLIYSSKYISDYSSHLFHFF